MTHCATYGKLHSLFYDLTKKYASEKEVSFYASFIDKDRERVLEAMSGSGRLQIPLIQRGYTVDGVDLSSYMLNRCRQRCAELDIVAELYEQSLEELSLPHTYAAVTIAVGSFQLITQRPAARQALQKLRAHMSIGGSLLIDTFVPEITEENRSKRIARIDSQSVVQLTTRYMFDEKTRIIDAFCVYELIVNGIIQAQEDELITTTWYTDDEFRQLLLEARFELVHIYEEAFGYRAQSRIMHARAV